MGSDTRSGSRALTPNLPQAHEAEFVAAGHLEGEFPSLGLPEVALIGRSNVGKSSFLNTLAAGRRIAYIGRTPGRTRSVNFYRIQNAAFVDLPGYGYAKVSKEERNRWKRVVESYLARTEVSLAILIVDARTGATASDQMMAQWLEERRLATLVAVTKIDKIGRNAARRVAGDVARTLEIDAARVLPFSGVTRDGAKEMWIAIGDMLAGVEVSGPQPQRIKPARSRVRHRRPSASRSSK